jgi:hypothetical protein
MTRGETPGLWGVLGDVQPVLISDTTVRAGAKVVVYR